MPNIISEKKWVSLNSVQECMDCSKMVGRANRALSVNFKTPDGYSRKYICVECEKYYRTRDPKLESSSSTQEH